MRRFKRNLIIAIVAIAALSLSLLAPAGAATTSSKPEVTKWETVACDIDPTGEVEAIQVVDWIALKGSGTVDVKAKKEFSEDPKIRGLSGFAKPEIEGDYIVWKGLEADGNSNHLATAVFSKEMVEKARTKIPLKIEFRYTLDGKEMKLEDIAGKSGHFRMECRLTNTSKEKRVVEYKDPDTGQMTSEEVEVYLPLVISPYDWNFDNQTFFNLEADPTGLVIPQPTVYTVGWSIPLFPPATDDSFTIWVEADVKNFHMDPLTLVVAFVFPETNQKNPLEEMGPGLTELYGGVKQLDAGLREAVAGLGSPTTPDTLLYGITAMYDGLSQMGSATEGLPAAKAGLDTLLIPGIDQMYYGIGSTTTPNTLLYAANGVRNGLKSGDPLHPGIYEGLQQIKAGLPLLIFGVQQIKDGVGNPATTPDPATLSDPRPQSAGGNGPDTFSYLIKFLNYQMTSTYFNPLNPSDPKNSISGTIRDSNVFVTYQSIDIKPNLIAGMDQISAGLVGTGGALDQLQYLYNNLGDATTPNTLLWGLDQIDKGVDEMMLGITHAGEGPLDPTLMYAIGAIIDNLNLIKYSLVSGNMANPGVKEGLLQISSGLGKAVAGIGSASTPDTLLYGASQIQSGLEQLKAGLIQATTEGTGVMAAGLFDSLTELNLTLGELEAIKQRGEEFNSFLGEAQDAENQLRFAFQMKSVPNYQEGPSSITALILSLVIIALLLVLGLVVFRRLA